MVNSTPKGVFITFEGIEGSGKTTQLARAEERLLSLGHCVLRFREPGGTRIGEDVRSVLLAAEHGNMSSVTELLLYEACRAQLVRESILPGLQQGNIVLCDRFADATVAYQGFGRGLDLGLIDDLNRHAMGEAVPDLTLLLDCPVDLGLRRVRRRIERGGGGTAGMDRLEAEACSFHERVRTGYLELSRQYPDRMRIVGTDRDPHTVHEEIMGWILNILRERGV